MQPQLNLTTAKEIKALLKDLGVNVRGLKDYKSIYGTTINTWTYKDASMWLYTYSPTMGTIEVYTTYVTAPLKMQLYNEMASHKYWMGRKDMTQDELDEMVINHKAKVKEINAKILAQSK